MYERRAETLATAPPLPNDHIGTGHRLSGAAIESIVVGGDCDWAAKTFFGERRREAQSMFSGESLAPSEATSIVRSMGFIPSTPPARDGLTYVVRAVGPRGRPVRVVIDARSGHVLSVRPIAALGAPYPVPLGRIPWLGLQLRPPAAIGRSDAYSPPPVPRAHGAGRSQAIAAICGGPGAAPRQSQRSDDSTRGLRRGGLWTD